MKNPSELNPGALEALYWSLQKIALRLDRWRKSDIAAGPEGKDKDFRELQREALDALELAERGRVEYKLTIDPETGGKTLTPISPTPWALQTLCETYHDYPKWAVYAIRDARNHCLAVVGQVDRATEEHNAGNAALMLHAPQLQECAGKLLDELASVHDAHVWPHGDEDAHDAGTRPGFCEICRKINAARALLSTL